MKKLFFILAFMLVGTFAFANNGMVNNFEEKIINLKNLNKMVENENIKLDNDCDQVVADAMDYYYDVLGMSMQDAMDAAEFMSDICEGRFRFTFW